MKRDEFKKRFPAIAKEMEEGKGKADLEFEVEPPKPQRRFAGSTTSARASSPHGVQPLPRTILDY